MAVFQTYGTDCWICGHPDALEVDHIDRLADGGDPYNLDNARPAHGSNYPCPVCVSSSTGRPRCCNQERNRFGPMDVTSQDAVSVDPNEL